MANAQKIRIRLKAYDHELIDQSAEKIIETAKRNGAKVSGPIPLPTEKQIVTILRAVHKYKDSREQFERRTHKRLIDIINPNQATIEALTTLEVMLAVKCRQPITFKEEKQMLNKAIIGKKVGMTQIFNADGKVIPCTVIEAGPCVVTQLKTEEKDGYNAVQFGFEDVKEARLNKPQKGHLKKAGDSLKKYLKEFRFEDCTPFQLGDVVKADMFVTGDYVDVTGTSKGKGYAGVIKRFNASRLKESHGTGPVHRHAGSMGACSDPSKIMKGKMMPGHMGAEQVTVQNLDVVKVDAELNLIAVCGAVPGPKGGIVVLKNTVKNNKVAKGEAGISKNPQKASARK